MHQVWHVLLDEEFLDAYKHGVVLKCADDVFRRVYPRILTYSADHPEKYYFLFKAHTHSNNHLLIGCFWPPYLREDAAFAPAVSLKRQV